MDSQDLSRHLFVKDPKLPLLCFERGEGIYLYESSGERIIDASGGPMLVNIGHGRPEVAEAGYEAMKKLTYILPVFLSEHRMKLSDLVASRFPEHTNRVYFCSGGSEAVESAIKFSRQYHLVKGNTGKYRMLSRKLSYHGNTIACVSLTGVEERRKSFLPMLSDTPLVEPCYCYRCPFDKSYPGCDMECAQDLETKIKKLGPDTVAAFFMEPVVASAAGATVPPPEYFPIIREICDRYDVLLVADEVVTGFGRTGVPMGMDNFGVSPDITTFAKGVSGGYAPMAGMIVKDELAEAFEEVGQDFQSIFSFSSHPMCCAIAAKVQETIDEEGLIDHAREMGEYLGERLERIRDLPHVGDVRGIGMLRAVEFVKDKDTKEPFPSGNTMNMKVIFNAAANGVLFYPGYYSEQYGCGDHVMISPPFIITKEEVELVVSVLEDAIIEVAGEQ